ncbi:FKBP12-associated protein [Apophysomyces ossiformis]|uniref:FKBP12-associated protein n=1 Tax=Apophysomyces ossiformis TaxID=679940 RepID=A0A8H7EV40_9FUNG|nr:FKBP12-associated protein [Apophysomyces ossiformis]
MSIQVPVPTPATIEPVPQQDVNVNEVTKSNSPSQNNRRGRRKAKEPADREVGNTTRESTDASNTSTQRRKRKPKAKKASDSTKDQSEGQSSKDAQTSNNKSNTQEPKENATSVKKNPRFSKDRPQGRLTDSTSSEQTKNTKRNRPRRGPKLVAPDADDLASMLAFELKTSAYECMICCDVVRPAHQTWACDCCWAVFHLTCAQKWASKSLQDRAIRDPVLLVKQ